MSRHIQRNARAVGFSLIELMIVLAIILVLMTLALPNLLRARQRAYEAAATAFLRQVHTSQETYRLRTEEYAELFADLQLEGQPWAGVPGNCRGRGGGGRGRGRGRGCGGGGSCDTVVAYSYIFSLESPSESEWDCVAEPLRDRPETLFFYIEEGGVIRRVRGNFADETSPPL